MKHLWQSFLERLRPTRSGSPVSQSRCMALLQAAIALAITLAWGPEIFLAMEMTALLEILGASLFLTAYAAGLKLKAKELCCALQSTVLPLGQVAVKRSSAGAHLKTLAAISVVVNATWCLCAVLIVGAYLQYLLKLAI